MSCRYSGKK